MLRMGSAPRELIGAKITVSNLERSLDFYTRLVGLQPVSPADVAAALTSDSAFAEIALNYSGTRRDAAIVLMRRRGVTPNREAAQLTWLMLKTPNLFEAFVRIEAEGNEALARPTPYDGAVFALVLDPDGYTVELLQVEDAA